MTELKPCKCELKFTIEPHGAGFAIYHARCIHSHGFNLGLLTEVDKLLNIADLESALNRPAESKIKADAVMDALAYAKNKCDWATTTNYKAVKLSHAVGEYANKLLEQGE